jgi:phage gp36-like protein
VSHIKPINKPLATIGKILHKHGHTLAFYYLTRRYQDFSYSQIYNSYVNQSVSALIAASRYQATS